jgi:hypothetical protein
MFNLFNILIQNVSSSNFIVGSWPILSSVTSLSFNCIVILILLWSAYVSCNFQQFLSIILHSIYIFVPYYSSLYSIYSFIYVFYLNDLLMASRLLSNNIFFEICLSILIFVISNSRFVFGSLFCYVCHDVCLIIALYIRDFVCNRIYLFLQIVSLCHSVILLLLASYYLKFKTYKLILIN